MYTSEPIPRPLGPPASATPLRDCLALSRLGVDERYVVLPRCLAESMPLPWQQQMAHLISELHQTYGGLPWPLYRVVPSRIERLIDLDEDQLTQAGYLLEIDASGELVYRDRDGMVVPDPASHQVMVPCPDPLPRHPPPPPGPGPVPPM